MRSKVQLKRAYGTSVFARIQHVRYLSWEDSFDVEFEDGLCFLEPQAGIRKANRISAHALPVSVEVDGELGSHFTIVYDTGEEAEVSWAFVREFPPSRSRATAVLSARRVITKPARVSEKAPRYGKAAKSRQPRR